GTVTATDADLPAQTVSFSLNGGVDAAKFSITSGGVLSFRCEAHKAKPHSRSEDKSHHLPERANDGNGSTTDQPIAVTVTPVNDNAPQSTAISTLSLHDALPILGTVTATDADLPAQTVSFSLNGGVDAAKFSITSGGVLSF